jgi:hypothetical protein
MVTTEATAAVEHEGLAEPEEHAEGAFIVQEDMIENSL